MTERGHCHEVGCTDGCRAGHHSRKSSVQRLGKMIGKPDALSCCSGKHGVEPHSHHCPCRFFIQCLPQPLRSPSNHPVGKIRDALVRQHFADSHSKPRCQAVGGQLILDIPFDDPPSRCHCSAC